MLPFEASRCGIAARHTRNVPSALTDWTWRQSANVISWKCENRRMPAMWHSASSRPKRAMHASNAAFTDASSDTSQTRASLSTPSAPACFAAASTASACTSTQKTRPPSLAIRSTVARPMPEAAPVINTTLSSNRRMEAPSSRTLARCEVPRRLARVDAERQEADHGRGDAVLYVACEVVAALLGRAVHDQLVDDAVGNRRSGGL